MFVSKILAFAVVLLIPVGHTQQLPLKQNAQIIVEKDQKVNQKEQTLILANEEIRELAERKRILTQQLEDEKKTAQDLRQKIADKKAAKAAEIAKTAQIAKESQAVIAIFSGPRGSCGDNQYAAYIYGMESGGRIPGNCNLTVRNAEGCIGIGQACPASKLLAVCPNLDYECENAFFTSYALSRYGGWAGAYAFWIAHKWW